VREPAGACYLASHLLMKMSRALPPVVGAVLFVAACDETVPATRAEQAFDSPYANPQGREVTCEPGSYLVGQRCVSESDGRDAGGPRMDDAAADAAPLDAVDATDGADGAPDAHDVQDVGDPSLADTGGPDAEHAEAGAADAAPEGGS
jgi:hypothetical protein